MDLDYGTAIKTYEQYESVKRAASELGISAAKLKKILVSSQAFQNETSESVQKLYNSGKSTTEISKILGLSKSCINMYLPYKKCIYNSDVPTKNALNIRKSRAKKQNQVS